MAKLALKIQNFFILSQGAFIRGGNATFENVEIHLDTARRELLDGYESKDWLSGNNTPKAGIVLGNRQTKDDYPYDKEVTLKNVTFFDEDDINEALNKELGIVSSASILADEETTTTTEGEKYEPWNIYAYLGENLTCKATLNIDEATLSKIPESRKFISDNITVNNI